MNIEKFCKQYKLGEVIKITKLTGGLMHKMFKVETTKVVEEKPQEEEKPSTTNKYESPSESEIISYSLEEYVNILCQGDKKFKEGLLARWGEIRKHIDNLNTRYVAQLLSDSNVGVASKDFILLVYDFKLLASRARQRNNLLLIRKFIKEIFDYDLEIFAVERAIFALRFKSSILLPSVGKHTTPILIVQ